MQHEKFGHEINRRIVESWTREEDNYRVKVSTWHDKTRKAFISNISECTIEKNDGYTMEKSIMYQSLNKLVQIQAVARYNYEKMSDFHTQAVAQVMDQVNSLIADLNRDAEGVA
jgi:competence transcription factor ComK